MKKIYAILIVLLSFFLFSCSKSEKGYQHGEVKFDNEIGCYFRATSSYTLSGGELLKKDTVVILYKSNNNATKLKNIETTGLGICRDNSEMELTQSHKITSETVASSSYLCSSKTIPGGGFKSLSAKVKYDLVKGAETTTDHEYEFNETMLTLTKDELNMIVENVYIKSIFPSVSIEGLNYTIEENSSFSIKIAFQVDAIENYHFDAQAFLVDTNNNVWDLVGYYGVSNLKDINYSQTITFPKGYEFSYVMLKVVYFENAETMNTYYYKVLFKDLIKN